MRVSSRGSRPGLSRPHLSSNGRRSRPPIRGFISFATALSIAGSAHANGLIPVDSPEAVQPTDIAYLSGLPDLSGVGLFEGVTEAGIRYRLSLESSAYNVHYSAVRISFERPVRAFGLLASVSGVNGYGSAPQVGFSAAGAVLDAGSGGYIGFISPAAGVSSVLLMSRTGQVSASHLDLRPEPLARDDRITIATGQTAMVSPDRLFVNDSLASGALVAEVPKHAEVFHLSPDGLLTYRPTAGFVGIDRFAYRAVDAAGDAASNPAWVEIEVVEAAPEPLWTMADRLETVEDAGPQSLDRWASLEGFGDVEFSVYSDPPSAFEVQPTMGQDGTLRFETARDFHGEARLSVDLVDAATGQILQSRAVQLAVAPVDDAPTLEPIDLQTIESGAALVVQARASEVDGGQIVRYMLVEGPEDAWIDPISGLLVWRPTTPQNRRFVIRAVEGGGNALFTDREFEVRVEPKALAPRLVAPTEARALPGQAVALRIGSDRLGDRYFLGSEEPGATLNPLTGQFTWTPTARHAGSTVRFLVTAVRGNLCSTSEFVVQVGQLETQGIAAMRLGGGKAAAKPKPKR